ncbi:recombinase family protein [Streptomyces sp. NBC_01500]|uniref:recombinase family protein n=1 Tax=Streptomyces sp. NBC_01500 TaxID=2903886 RepID=UPI00225562E9|nr:recombinase family protein [Streptomyces sp. NBC_01500]MCX4552262.1 recombinase family protein [Streptomyces sp. NBC_01500]
MDRYGIYERLSRMTDASTSIQRQDETCRAEVIRRNGRVIGDAYVDEGVSGAKPPLERPAMKALLENLASIDIVMVWKIDRIARSFVGFADIIKELDKGGVALVSATEPIDMTGPQGRAMAQMIAIFAELEREMIKARVQDSMRKAKEDKRFHGGRVPYGLTPAPHPTGKGRILVRDQYAVGVLREVLLWILEGATLTDCARKLNERGEATSRQRGAVTKKDKAQDAQWRTRALRWILESPTMLGYRPVPGGGVEVDDDGLPVIAWPPVFSRDEMDALQSTMDGLQQAPRKAPAASHWLSGAARCFPCAGNLKQRTSPDGVKAFTCGGSSETGRHRPGVYINRAKLVDWVREEFPRIYGVLPEVKRVWHPGSDATRDLAQVNRTIRALRDDRDAGLYESDEDETEFRDRMARLLARRKALQAVPVEEPHWEKQETGRTLAEVWTELSDEGRGKLLIEYDIHVWVRPSKGGAEPLSERVSFGPADPEQDALEDVAHQESL